MIRRIQTCDRCRNERLLEKDDSPELAGWRTFPFGTACASCMGALQAWFEETKSPAGRRSTNVSACKVRTPLGWFACVRPEGHSGDHLSEIGNYWLNDADAERAGSGCGEGEPT